MKPVPVGEQGIKDGRRNKLYNFIINTYGISKESILSIIDTRLENVLSKEIRSKLSSNHFESMIMSQVAKFIKDGTYSLYHSPTSFESLVKKYMHEEIRKIVEENYEINIKIRE